MARPDARKDTPMGRHVLTELGFETRWVGDDVHGTAPIVPEMHVPDTECLRTSVLATWADIVSGWLVIRHVEPRVPVTLELDVHLFAPLSGLRRVDAVGRVAKAGRNVIVPTVDFTDEEGTPLGFAAASFMVAPDPDLRMPAIDLDDREPAEAGCASPWPTASASSIARPGWWRCPGPNRA